MERQKSTFQTRPRLTGFRSERRLERQVRARPRGRVWNIELERRKSAFQTRPRLSRDRLAAWRESGATTLICAAMQIDAVRVLAEIGA